MALDPNLDDNFGVSVDIYNDIAIVGANLDDESGANRGAAYIFRFNGTTWVQEQKLIASDAEDGDQFGTSVAIYDTIAVIGAYGDDVGGFNTGSVYVYYLCVCTFIFFLRNEKLFLARKQKNYCKRDLSCPIF